MQIMPTLAYLTPMTLLFLIGAPPSTIATLIYAIPPAIRITALGHPRRARASGRGGTVARARPSARCCARSSCRSPVGRSASAINQTIMLALSMVVITGAHRRARARPEHRSAPCSKVDVGAAFDAGLAIVILAIVLDRADVRRRRVARSRAPGSRAADAARAGWLRPIGAGDPGRVGLARPVRRRRDAVPGRHRVLVPEPVNDVRRLAHRHVLRPSTLGDQERR